MLTLHILGTVGLGAMQSPGCGLGLPPSSRTLEARLRDGALGPAAGSWQKGVSPLYLGRQRLEMDLASLGALWPGPVSE